MDKPPLIPNKTSPGHFTFGEDEHIFLHESPNSHSLVELHTNKPSTGSTSLHLPFDGSKDQTMDPSPLPSNCAASCSSKLNAIYTNTTNSSRNVSPGSPDGSSPDLEEVLHNFGIIYKNLIPVPLNSYQWWRFSTGESEPTSISQRIKFLRRKVDVNTNLDPGKLNF